jgi:hypothetical protein
MKKNLHITVGIMVMLLGVGCIAPINSTTKDDTYLVTFEVKVPKVEPSPTIDLTVINRILKLNQLVPVVYVAGIDKETSEPYFRWELQSYLTSGEVVLLHKNAKVVEIRDLTDENGHP